MTISCSARGGYKESEQALEHAPHATPRPDRPLADKGLTKEIQVLLVQVN